MASGSKRAGSRASPHQKIKERLERLQTTLNLVEPGEKRTLVGLGVKKKRDNVKLGRRRVTFLLGLVIAAVMHDSTLQTQLETVLINEHINEACSPSQLEYLIEFE